MDIKKIKAIIELVKESGISELEITEGEEKLKISTNNISQQTPIYNNNLPLPIPVTSSDGIPKAHDTQSTTVISSNSVTPAANNLEQQITSPMVGTFYSASSPTSNPLVAVGQTVKIGQVLCIIEAMKLMNQIESDKNGVIKEILVKDGAPVEFGQPLFMLE